MQSERAQILTLLAARRIDVAEAERPLVLVGSRDRFFIMALWTTVAVVILSATQNHVGQNLYAVLHSTLQSVTGSDAFHNLHLFLYRVMGELP